MSKDTAIRMGREVADHWDELLDPRRKGARLEAMRRRSALSSVSGGEGRRLLIRCRGTIGDTLHYLARMPAVRAAYGRHRIICAIQSNDPLRVRALLAADPHVDAVWLTSEWNRRFDPAARFLARARIAWRDDYLEFLLPGWGDCARFTPAAPWMPHLDPAARAFAERFHEGQLGGRAFAVVHAASRRDKGADWEWPGYPELIERLADRTGGPVVVVGDPVPLRAARGSVHDLTRNGHLGIGLRPMLALVLRAALVVGGDSGFEVAPWLAGRRVISLVPDHHLQRGYRIAVDGQVRLANVHQWLPPAAARRDRQVVVTLDTTTVDQVMAMIDGMDALPRADRPRPPAKPERPRALGVAAVVHETVPDLLRPLLRILAPPILRTLGRS